MRNYGPDRPCSKCGRPASEVNFSLHKDGTRCSQCKECAAARTKRYVAAQKADPVLAARYKQRQKENYKRWNSGDYSHNRDNIKTAKLKYRYGLTIDDVSQMYLKQKGLCGICNNPIKDPTLVRIRNGTHIDHCHETKQVRGLLCHKCNLLLGLAKHDPGTLLNAVSWLNKD